jgi:exonuclease SbcD
MRILHTADWHLGRQLHSASLIDDQSHALEQLFMVIKDTRPECLIVAGDIFDRAVPPVEAVSLFNQTLSRFAADYSIPILLIAGNHDSPERIDYGSGIFAKSGVFIKGTFTAEPGVVRLADVWGDVDFTLLPYLEPPVARQVLGSPDLHTHHDALRAACTLSLAVRRPNARQVLIAHAFVDGGKESESERPLSVGGSGRVPASAFDEFHYVALGHLHEPQEISRPAVRYSGSLYKYSFSEAQHQKSFSLVELDRNGAIQVTPIPYGIKRDVRRVRGEFREILANPIAEARNDYILAEITDTAPIIDAMSQLRTIYPNALDIMRIAHAEFVAQEEAAGRRLEQNERQLFESFFRYVTNDDASAAQIAEFGRIVDELNLSKRGA